MVKLCVVAGQDKQRFNTGVKNVQLSLSQVFAAQVTYAFGINLQDAVDTLVDEKVIPLKRERFNDFGTMSSKIQSVVRKAFEPFSGPVDLSKEYYASDSPPVTLFATYDERPQVYQGDLDVVIKRLKERRDSDCYPLSVRFPEEDSRATFTIWKGDTDGIIAMKVEMARAGVSLKGLLSIPVFEPERKRSYGYGR